MPKDEADVPAVTFQELLNDRLSGGAERAFIVTIFHDRNRGIIVTKDMIVPPYPDPPTALRAAP